MSRKEKIVAMLSSEPDDPFLNFGLAMELAKESAVDAAAERFDRVLALDPKYIVAYQQKAVLFHQAQRPNEARQALKLGVAAANRLGEHHAAEEMQALLESWAD